MKRFTAAALQFSPVPMDADANMKKAESMIAECVRTCGAELIVLPESFTTGFTTAVPKERLWEAIEPMPGAWTEEAAAWSRKYGTYIIFPSYEKGPDGIIWNSAALIGPKEGFIGAYKKTHPFPTERLANGTGWTTPGNDPFCVQTEIGKIGIVICYDGDFPELVRVTALMGAEVVVRPSAFFRTFDHWELTNRARAYDNHVYMVASNVAGYDASGDYCFGGSMIVSPTGVKLAQARGTEEYVWASLDPEPIKTIYPNSSAKMEFDHIEDRNIGVYRTILQEGKSAFEPARRIPYKR
ncbi:MAG TPA: carbon-nitrogen hydrolase family protein [Bacillota bacterium]|nr:carbon-nitrogen hydrolase family protein [Bacillota bacterium]